MSSSPPVLCVRLLFAYMLSRGFLSQVPGRLRSVRQLVLGRPYRHREPHRSSIRCAARSKVTARAPDQAKWVGLSADNPSTPPTVGPMKNDAPPSRPGRRPCAPRGDPEQEISPKPTLVAVEPAPEKLPVVLPFGPVDEAFIEFLVEEAVRIWRAKNW